MKMLYICYMIERIHINVIQTIENKYRDNKAQARINDQLTKAIPINNVIR